MEKELSLIKTNRFSGFINKIKSFFVKSTKKEEIHIQTEKIIPVKEMDDFECLKGIMEGKINIKGLDKDLKKRLIKLCNGRLEELNKEISKTDEEIAKHQNIINQQEAKQKFVELVRKFNAREIEEKDLTSEEKEQLIKYYQSKNKELDKQIEEKKRTLESINSKINYYYEKTMKLKAE